MAVVRSVGRMLERAAPILARLPRGAVMVEVGVSTALLAEHLLKTRPDIEWVGIDPWAGSGNQRACYKRSGDIHAKLSDQDAEEHMKIAQKRVKPFGERALIIREWSPEAAMLFGRETVDLCFLDGDHSLEGVRADIDAWWPVIKPGAWLGGHDYKNGDPRFRFGVEQAVDTWADEGRIKVELDGGLTWWTRKP